MILADNSVNHITSWCRIPLLTLWISSNLSISNFLDSIIEDLTWWNYIEQIAQSFLWELFFNTIFLLTSHVMSRKNPSSNFYMNIMLSSISWIIKRKRTLEVWYTFTKQYVFPTIFSSWSLTTCLGVPNIWAIDLAGGD